MHCIVWLNNFPFHSIAPLNITLCDFHNNHIVNPLQSPPPNQSLSFLSLSLFLSRFTLPLLSVPLLRPFLTPVLYVRVDSVVQLTKESHTPVDPVALWLVPGQVDGQDVVGGVTGGGEGAPSC